MDDWGWASVGYHRNSRNEEIHTPNIDHLVRNGLELNQHYAFNWCSPSRSSLLTGRLPFHVNDASISQTYVNPNDSVSGFYGIPRNMTTIAAKLRSAGYSTHHVGKWDVGMATRDHIPKGKGFDTSLGYLYHLNDYFNETVKIEECNNNTFVDLWDTDSPARVLNGTGYEERLFLERVVQIIENHNKSTPLFLFYALHLVHYPLEVPKYVAEKFKFINNHDRQYYSAMVMYMDGVVGSVVRALKKHSLWDNLLLVTSSDNGGPLTHGGNNFPLKGGKWTDWQGGVRVNAFVSGGFLPMKMRGKTTDGYVHLADWYSTFSALAGVDPTDERAAKAKLPPIDSLNMWPLISGQTKHSPRKDIPISNFTLISGDFKILTGNVSKAGWTGPVYPNNTGGIGINTTEHCGDGCLYNIKLDPEERINLATKLPHMFKRLQTKLAHYQLSHFKPNRGKEWSGACEAALKTHKGFWGPFMT